MSISVVINTLNEELNIKCAIQSVTKFADEIIVVDMKSVDQTTSIAKKLGARVFTHEPMHYVEPARNFAISKATGDWIFILDADEEAPVTLLTELRSVVEKNECDFVRIPRKNMIFGKWMKHSRWWPDENIRFFKKGAVVWDDEIHSIPVTNGMGINLESNEKLAITHHHYESVEQYIDRLNRYTTIQARELHKKKTEVSFRHFIQKPVAEFLSRYFAGEGYKDGIHGLALAFLQGTSELVLYAKLWQLNGFTQESPSVKSVIGEITEAQKSINYWKAHVSVQQGGGVQARLKRKFRLQ